jgi:hypothetical protein
MPKKIACPGEEQAEKGWESGLLQFQYTVFLARNQSVKYHVLKGEGAAWK